jgi:glycosyltransferase involved in cell wall biosynthesis
MLTSVIIRTFNEAKHLPSLLHNIEKQTLAKKDVEVIIVDSGSTDDTLSIAEGNSARIVHIRKDEFSFGRSLNIGCAAARGENLVFVSGHCIPVADDWLGLLVKPLAIEPIAYTYGRQIGDRTSRFSECQLFKKYFPSNSKIPQTGFFCNNANAALRRDVWSKNPFDEELTGLEDMELAQRLIKKDLAIAYVSEAPVYHLHSESWRNVRMRYEREAIALQRIMPQVQVGMTDFFRYFISALMLDSGAAVEARLFRKKAIEIFMFRLMQYWGSYRGNHEHRKLSHRAKEEYFYPS